LDDLNAQIAKQRQDWEEEQAANQRKFAEERSERNKARQREEEDYQYTIAQKHRKEEDAFATLLARRELENRDKQERLEKQWAERETELKKREQELVDLRTFKESVPELIKKESNQSTIIATNSLKKEYENKMALAAKDTEIEKRLADQQINLLQQNAAKMQQQIDDLKADLVK